MFCNQKGVVLNAGDNVVFIGTENALSVGCCHVGGFQIPIVFATVPSHEQVTCSVFYIMFVCEHVRIKHYPWSFRIHCFPKFSTQLTKKHVFIGLGPVGPLNVHLFWLLDWRRKLWRRTRKAILGASDLD